MVRKLAENSCIIIGRGACEALKGNKNVVNIFIHADLEERVKRCMVKESIDEKAARIRVKEVDSERISFFEQNTGSAWGDMDIFDIILDSSELGFENCADAICGWLEHYDYI